VTDDTISSTALASSEPPEQPHFRLQHMFVLTAVMAVMLALQSPQTEFPEQFQISPLYRHFLMAWGIVVAILNALAITVAGYGLYWRKRGGRFLEEPGHWLLLSMAIAALVSVVQVAGLRLLAMFTDVDLQTTQAGAMTPEDWVAIIATMLLSFASIGVHIGVNVYFGRKQSAWRWRWMFYLKAFALFLWVIGMLAIVVCLVRTILLDRRDGIHRDATHKCGAALELAIDSFMAVVFVVMFAFVFIPIFYR